MAAEIADQLKPHGFSSLREFAEYIKKFENSFEEGAAVVVADLLTKYESRLYNEGQRYQASGEVAALHAKLGGVRTQQKAFEKNTATTNRYKKQTLDPRVPGLGSQEPAVSQKEAAAAHVKAGEAGAAVKAELSGLAQEHPIFQEEGLPDDRKIDRSALADATEAQLGALLQSHVANKTKDAQEAKDRLAGKPELIYKMDKMMPEFYASMGVAPGSIYDMIIRHKLSRDTIQSLVTGALVALVAIALTVVTLGAATPAIVAAGAGVGAFGLSAYMAYDEYQQYAQEKDLADVGLVNDPSVAWLVVAVVGAAVEMGAAVTAVKALGSAAKTLNAGGDVNDFVRVVKAAQEAGEIDTRIAAAAERAATARQAYADASGSLGRALGGKAYSLPGPFADPDVYRLLVQMAKAKIQEGVASFQVFAGELKQARVMAKLGDLSPEELAKAKEAWEQALRLTKSTESPVDIMSDGGRLIGRYSNGSHLEILSKRAKLHGGNSIKLDPNATTTVSGTLDDVNVVATRGYQMPGATSMGPNPGGVNILRSPKWKEIQTKHLALRAKDEIKYWQTVTDEFWEAVNKPWLDAAISRGDNLRFVSSPTDQAATFVTNGKGEFVLDAAGQKIRSIFGREVDYLISQGYKFLSDGTAVKGS